MIFFIITVPYILLQKEKVEIIQKQTIREFLTNKTIPLLDKYIFLVCRYCPFVYQVVIYTLGF